MKERDLQKLVIDYLQLALGRQFMVLHLPAERLAGAGFYQSGAVGGLPDLLIAGKPSPWNPLYPINRQHFVAFIELKTGKGKLRPAQEAFRDRCIALGIPWACCRSVEEAEVALRSWGLGPKASVAR